MCDTRGCFHHMRYPASPRSEDDARDEQPTKRRRRQSANDRYPGRAFCEMRKRVKEDPFHSTGRVMTPTLTGRRNEAGLVTPAPRRTSSGSRSSFDACRRTPSFLRLAAWRTYGGGVSRNERIARETTRRRGVSTERLKSRKHFLSSALQKRKALTNLIIAMDGAKKVISDYSSLVCHTRTVRTMILYLAPQGSAWTDGLILLTDDGVRVEIPQALDSSLHILSQTRLSARVVDASGPRCSLFF